MLKRSRLWAQSGLYIRYNKIAKKWNIKYSNKFCGTFQDLQLQITCTFSLVADLVLQMVRNQTTFTCSSRTEKTNTIHIDCDVIMIKLCERTNSANMHYFFFQMVCSGLWAKKTNRTTFSCFTQKEHTCYLVPGKPQKRGEKRQSLHYLYCITDFLTTILTCFLTCSRHQTASFSNLTLICLCPWLQIQIPCSLRVIL